MKGNKIEFTPEQVAYLKKHFQNTHNEVLADELGVSPRTVIRRARELGLKKSTQFMHSTQRAAAAAAKYFNIKRGTYPPKGFRIPRSEEFYFKPGHKETKAQQRRRIAKVRETRNATIARERSRLRAGLAPKTKLRLNENSRQECAARWYLIKRGYRCENKYDMYYDADTKRSNKYENTPGPFRFHATA